MSAQAVEAVCGECGNGPLGCHCHEPNSGALAFYRTEMRCTSKGRALDCHCRLDRGELYRYAVAKVIGIPGVWQSLLCDFHMRLGDRY